MTTTGYMFEVRYNAIESMTTARPTCRPISMLQGCGVNDYNQARMYKYATRL